jgi:beta-glucosidase
MAMEPFNYNEFENVLKQLVNEGAVSEERINDAVRRILTLKFEAGIFEHPYAYRSMFDSVGNAYHRSIARQCVRESLVLLKKRDNVLPLAKNNLKIHVAGSNADDIGNQCGGWTIGWQGYSGNITTGTSIYKGLQEVAPDNEFFFYCRWYGMDE